MFTKKPDREDGEFGSSSPSDSSRSFGERLAATPRPATTAPAPTSIPSSSSASSPSPSYGKSVPSIIGEDMTITGNIVSKGEIQVDGEIQGDVRCVSLLLGDKSRVTGGVVADDVVVRGTVNGSIRGLRVTLQAQSKVDGDVYHQSLAIEQGAYFEGKSRRSEDPVSQAPLTEGRSETNSAAPKFSTPGTSLAKSDEGSKADAAE
jgi:cytoskeletal protein CcmA (bactofilin family)